MHVQVQVLVTIALIPSLYYAKLVLIQRQADKTRAREQVHTAAISALRARPCLSALPPFQCVKLGAQ